VERPEVIGLGASTLDVINLVDHYPLAEDVFEAESIAFQGGGPVSTAMVTLARLGVNVAILDTVGDDWVGKVILDEYRREGVSTENIHVMEGRYSPVSTILVGGDGSRSIVFHRGTTPGFAINDLPVELFRTARILHVNGRYWDTCLAACELARKNHMLVSFDGGAGRYLSRFNEIVPYLDICIVARDFANKHAGSTILEDAAQLLLSQGPAIVVITDGERGSWIYPSQDEHFHQPAFKLAKVVDTTGAGDVYHGAFLFGLLQGYGLERTARLASAAAAIKCQSIGGRKGIPDLAELNAFLQANDG
jgi:sugar/nucleoside kinase (ribokinase family)